MSRFSTPKIRNLRYFSYVKDQNVKNNTFKTIFNNIF